MSIQRLTLQRQVSLVEDDDSQQPAEHEPIRGKPDNDDVAAGLIEESKDEPRLDLSMSAVSQPILLHPV